jgi:hypothetical protein
MVIYRYQARLLVVLKVDDGNVPNVAGSVLLDATG